MGRALGLQAVGKGADRPPPSGAEGEGEPTPHCTPAGCAYEGSPSSPLSSRISFFQAPWEVWDVDWAPFPVVKKRLCIGGSPACSRGSSSEPSRGVGGDPRPARDPADALGSRLGPHCLSSAICRRSCRHTSPSAAAQPELLGARSPGAMCGKFHTALARIGQGPERGERVCIFSGGAGAFPPRHKSNLVGISIRLITDSGRRCGK